MPRPNRLRCRLRLRFGLDRIECWSTLADSAAESLAPLSWPIGCERDMADLASIAKSLVANYACSNGGTTSSANGKAAANQNTAAPSAERSEPPSKKPRVTAKHPPPSPQIVEVSAERSEPPSKKPRVTAKHPPPSPQIVEVLPSDKAHQDACSRWVKGKKFKFGADCHRCLAIRNCKKWSKLAAFRRKGQVFTWLRVRSGGDPVPFGVWCVACAWQRRKNRWASSVVEKPTKSQVHVHGRSAGHERALQAYVASEWSTMPEEHQARRLPDDTTTIVQDVASAAATPYVPTAVDLEREYCRLTRTDSILQNHKCSAWADWAVAAGSSILDPGRVGNGPLTTGVRKRRAREAELDVQDGSKQQMRKRRRKIIWCLAEALRERWRTKARACDNFVIMADKKCPNMLGRFSCASDTELTACDGTLSLEKCVKGDAVSEALAIADALKHFCTLGYGAPHIGAGSGPGGRQGVVLDTPLLERCRVKNRTGVADGAASAKKSLVILRTSGFVPNKQNDDRDMAHAGRAIYKRPWEHGDPGVKTYMDDMFVGKKSVASILQNSAALSEVFKDAQENTKGLVDTKFSNVGVAFHRFSSHQRPVGRGVLRFRAFARAMVDIARARRSRKEGRRISEVGATMTDELCVMHGCMADAGHEGIVFIRQVDKERPDLEKLGRYVRDYVQNLEVLFGETGIAFHPTRGGGTYTSAMMATLSENQMVLNFGDKGVVILGGKDLFANDDLIRRCRRRMREYLQMARAAIETEFPSWRFILNFEAFNLESKLCDTRLQRCLSGLAWHHSMNERDLRAEWDKVYPLAKRRYSALGDSKQAVVAALQGLRCRGVKMPLMRRITCRLVSETGSTVGLEGAFAQTDRTLPRRRSLLSTTAQCDELIIVVDGQRVGGQQLLRLSHSHGVPQYETGPWAAEAIAIWKRYYPRAQQRRLIRHDKGATRRAAVGRTEKKWLAKRRAAVSAACVERRAQKTRAGAGNHECSAVADPAVVAGSSMLGPGRVGYAHAPAVAKVAPPARVEKELVLQRNRLEKNVEDAHSRGMLCPSDCRELGLTASPAPPLQIDSPVPAALAIEKLRSKARREGTGLPKVAAEWLERPERTVYKANVELRSKHRSQLRDRKLKVVEHQRDADIVLVPSLQDIPGHITQIASLIGGRLTTTDFLLPNAVSTSPHPASIKYVPASLLAKRLIYLSRGICERRVAWCQIIKHAKEIPGAAWSVTEELNAYKLWARAAPTGCIALYTKNELGSMEEKERPKGATTLNDFLGRKGRVSAAHSSDGISLQ